MNKDTSTYNEMIRGVWMDLFRIVLKKTNKRKYSNSPGRDVIMVLLFVFLLPYVISCLWGHVGEESAILFRRTESEKEWIDENYEVEIIGQWGKKRLSMQDYLVEKLEMVMPKETESGILYEPEALKAQAVLLRTQLWSAIVSDREDGDGTSVTLQDDAFFHWEENPLTWEEECLYREAVCETDGIYLSYEGKPVKAAFFPISNGRTRNASEVMPGENYPYFAGTECERDLFASEYQSRLCVSKREYCRLMREIFDTDATEEALWDSLELSYDSAEYVMSVKWNGRSCSGEIFRDVFGLNSSSFRMEWGEEEVTFYVRGVGHGLGMSQYGANEKAVSGDTFDQILQDYFFQAELVKIE